MGAEGHAYRLDPDGLAALPENKEKVILLVHGFHTSQADAARCFRAFRALLEDANPALLSSLRTSYWPGLLVLGLADYGRALEMARQCALWIVAQIEKWRNESKKDSPPHIIIIAHSMGCRLVLEALQTMCASGAPERMDRLELVLMGAAVPKDSIGPLGTLKDSVRIIHAAHVLHSRFDEALGVVFKIGQVGARELGLGEAVGLHGRPFEEKFKHDMARFRYRHRHYWVRPETVAEITAALALTTLSGKGSALPGSALLQALPPEAPPLRST